MDINKIVVFTKLLFGKQDFRYLIGYKNSEKIGPVEAFVPQMIICKRNFDKNRLVSFFNKKRKRFY